MSRLEKVEGAKNRCKKLDSEFVDSCKSAVSVCGNNSEASSFSIYIKVKGKMKQFKDLTFDKCLSMSPLLPKIYKSKIEKVVAHGASPEPEPAPRPEPTPEPRPEPTPEPGPESTLPEGEYETEDDDGVTYDDLEIELGGNDDSAPPVGEEDAPPVADSSPDVSDTPVFKMMSSAGICWASGKDMTENKSKAMNNMLDRAGVYARNNCPEGFKAAVRFSRTKFTKCAVDGKEGFKASASFQCARPEDPDEGLQDLLDEGIEKAEELMRRR